MCGHILACMVMPPHPHTHIIAIPKYPLPPGVSPQQASSFDSGPPVLPASQTCGVQVELKNGGDEHGILLWPSVCAGGGGWCLYRCFWWV